jgi:hypothetical protein
MGDGDSLPPEVRKLRQLEEENAQLRKRLKAMERERERQQERVNKP